MTSDRTQRNLRLAAALVAKADALLITAGAGMSVDSGLPDFRGGQGFWRAYPPLEKLQISFEEMAQPHWFDSQPEMAWAFYGHRQQLYRETKPHAGYSMLHDWGRAMPAGYYVVTSNVDGHFQAAGYPADQILELHGNVHRHQCLTPCCKTIWHYRHPGRPPDLPPDLQIDLASMRARGRLPRCPECDGMARPNVLMFGDASFVPEVRRVQQDRYAAWAASVRGRRLVVVEIGAGTALPAIRRVGEDLVERGLATLIRVNPDADRSDEPAIAIKLRALEALNHISEQLPDRFRSDHSQAALSAGFGANLNESYRDNQTDAVTFVSRDLDDIKWHKMFPSRWRFRLPTGSEAWIEKLDVALTYELWGGDTGLPGRDHCGDPVRAAVAFVQSNFGHPDPVVVPPRLFDASSPSPILPAVRFAARVRSCDSVNERDDNGSVMNLIWFAEMDDAKSILSYVEDAVRQIDWRKLATGYSY